MQEILRKLDKLDDVSKELSALSQYVYRGQPPPFDRSESSAGSLPMKSEVGGDMELLSAVTPGMPPLHSAVEQLETPYGAQTTPSHNVAGSRIEEPALPPSHFTGAHHLMTRWTTIARWFSNVGVTDENYVYQVEQPPLALFNWKRDDAGPQEHSVNSPPAGGMGESGFAQSPPEASWVPRLMSGTPKSDTGGMGLDGGLRLDGDTIRRFHDSFITNMWIIHPFIDPQALREMVDVFVASYSPGSRSPRFAAPNVANRDAYSSVPAKRKRQSGAPDDNNNNNSPGSPRGPYPPQQRRVEFESTIDNAIVLLVLALGNILEHDEFLLGEPASTTHGRGGTGNSHNFVKPSPPLNPASMPFSNMPSPGFDPSRSTAGSRGSSADRPQGYVDWKERRRQFANTARIPGIAYFAQATDILGNHYANNDIKHAQAFMLAGLYYGQLGRVFESWRWINAGCCVIDMMLKFRYNDEIHESRRKARGGGSYDDMVLESQAEPLFDNSIQIVVTLFWSAVQLDRYVLFASLLANYATNESQ